MSDIAASAPPVSPLSKEYRRYAMVFLLIVGTLNVVDRQVINILSEPIKNELDLLDWHIGLLTGLTFAIFYTILGLPIAQLAERTNRSHVISASLVTWSAFTIACGYAQNFIQLCLARMGVAVGEAGCSPCAHSLISDYYPREQRASGMAFYGLASPFGAFAGMMVGGMVADQYGWRIAFIVCGLPGFFLAALCSLTLIEPRKKFPEIAAAAAVPKVSIINAVRAIGGKRTFWLVTFGGALKAFISYGMAPFIAPYFFRNHAAEISALAADFGLQAGGFLGLSLGIVLGIGGAIGTFLGGWIADRYAERDIRAWAKLPAIAALFTPFTFTAALLAPSVIPAMALLFLNGVFASLWQGPVFATAQSVAPARTRALASALLLFVVSLVGLGLGPLSVGILSDVLAIQYDFGSGDGVRWSLIAFSFLSFGSFFLFWAARKTIAGDIVE